ncbi:MULTISPECIES: hypothetical protein [unclassified Variovorax]|uniref:hypothetical protein n=1 Tax=unclassified Variovorax TaxID=663243 RepID=UPI000A754B0B|nr:MULTISPECIES: hypothetical protein [unclassified Variovorax]PNG58655.1 hypothetical protein CHC07_00380 [Variovorax sp. B4]PNG61555.1 hypothetical protein CHC06_01456 [Variovorax sp. B2]VTV12415.1 hypothetical protein WDL1CHR_03209 [Variovorax sp. WDL1]
MQIETGVLVGYEVDFFPAEGGGTAILVRWGMPGNYKLLVCDGGTRDSAQRLVQHVRTYCLSSHVDYVVSSHPDARHAEGLELILERLSVGELWVHRPWAHTERTWTGMATAQKLEKLALARQVPVHEPFAGAVIGPFTVLSPNRSWYVEGLLPAFGTALPRGAGLTLADAARWVLLASAGMGSRWDFEPLPRDAATSAEDESSVVLYGEFEGRGVLLTSNAGIRALSDASTFAEHLGLGLPMNIRLMQVPNEGKPDHLSSRVLDRLVGERQPREQREYTKTAFMSAPQNSLPMGSRIVTDALKRRGVLTFLSQGTQLHHAYDMPERSWYPAKPMGADA